MIDFATIIILFVLSNFIIALFLFFYYLSFRENQHLKFGLYIISKLLQGFSYLFIVLRPNISVFWSSAMGTSLLLFGIGIEIYVLVTIKQHHQIKKLITLMIVAAVFSFILLFVFEPVYIRYFLRSFFMSLFFLYGGFGISFAKSESKMLKLTRVCLLFIFAAYLANGIHHLISREIPDSFFSPSRVRSIINTFLFLLTYILPVLYLLIINEFNNTYLASLNASRDKLLSIISHDLRNPYNAIMNLSEMIVEDLTEKNYSDIESYARIINGSAKKGFDLLNNVLKWLEIQSEHVKFSPESVDVNELLKNIERLYQPNIKQKEIHLIIEVPENFLIYADKFMLETIFRNLINNAIKYSHSGGSIWINASMTDEENKFYVRDEGIGISENDTGKLFNLESNFTRLGTGNEKGTGLGLLLCKEFVEIHKGEIWVESILNKGTTFYFTIP